MNITASSLLVDAASYLAIMVAALAIRTRRGRAPEPLPVGARAPAGWAMRRDPLLRSITIAVAAVVTGVSAVNVADVFFVRGVLHGSATVYGLLSAVWTGAMMLGAWLLARRPLRDGAVAVALLVSLAAACGAVALAAAVPAVAWMVPLWLFGGIFNGSVNVASGVLVGRRAPAEARGRAFAVFGGVANGANAVGYLLAGLALAVLSPRAVIALAGAVGLAVALAFAVPMIRAATRDQPVPADAPQVALVHE